MLLTCVYAIFLILVDRKEQGGPEGYTECFPLGEHITINGVRMTTKRVFGRYFAKGNHIVHIPSKEKVPEDMLENGEDFVTTLEDQCTLLRWFYLDDASSHPDRYDDMKITVDGDDRIRHHGQLWFEAIVLRADILRYRADKFEWLLRSGFVAHMDKEMVRMMRQE
jgi:hypothetical protein